MIDFELCLTNFETSKYSGREEFYACHRSQPSHELQLAILRIKQNNENLLKSFVQLETSQMRRKKLRQDL